MTGNQTRLLGAAFWIVLGVISMTWLGASGTKQDRAGDSAVSHQAPLPLLLESVWQSPQRVTMTDSLGLLIPGDSVFARDAQQQWRAVGYVVDVQPVNGERQAATASEQPATQSAAGNEVSILLFDAEERIASLDFVSHRATGRVDEILATLLPGKKRDELAARLTLAMEMHGQAVTEAVLPLLIDSLRQSIPVIEQELANSLQRHQDEVDALINRYREDVLKDQLMPLVREEILPIVRLHGEPPAETIGREIWGRASLWRFGWRAIYDQSPLPERELVKEEWRRFVDQEVVPIIESHLEEIVEAVELIVKDVASNQKLRSELAKVAQQITEDPEARKLLRTILTEAVVDNDQLREVWISVWTSPQAKASLKEAGKRIEPILREIGDEVMGTQSEGIEPGFARVLRNQILGKDRSWVTMQPRSTNRSDGEPIRTRHATGFMPYPVVYLAKPDALVTPDATD